MSSKTFTVPPILGCLKAAEQFILGNSLSKSVEWTPSSGKQEAFLHDFVSRIKDIDSLGDVLKSIADRDPLVINRWLKDNGFDIQLSGNVSQDQFAVASILDVLVEWIEKGRATTIRGRSGEYEAVYEAVRLSDQQGVSIYSGRKGWNPVAAIKTKGGERVFMTVSDDLSVTSKGFTGLIDSHVVSMYPDASYDSVVFPMVDYNKVVDVSWLCGLKTGDWGIGEALQQTKFRMNETGARVESAVAMTLCRSLIAEQKKTLTIDRPFLLWIEREGCDFPLFAGFFEEDCWKNPNGLDERKAVAVNRPRKWFEKHAASEDSEVGAGMPYAGGSRTGLG